MLRPHASAVAIAASPQGQIPDVYWVLESNPFLVTHQWCATLQLSLRGVPSIAIFWNYLPPWADMLPVTTSEAPWRVEVANVVGMCPPVYLHVRKHRELIDALKISNRSVDRGSPTGNNIEILDPIEPVYVLCNRLRDELRARQAFPSICNGHYRAWGVGDDMKRSRLPASGPNVRTLANAEHQQIDAVLLNMPENLNVRVANFDEASRSAKFLGLHRNEVVESRIELLLDFVKTSGMLDLLRSNDVQHVDLGMEFSREGNRYGSRVSHGRMKFGCVENAPERRRFWSKGWNPWTYSQTRKTRGSQDRFCSGSKKTASH